MLDTNENKMKTLEELTSQLGWYHSIELHPGFFTPGFGFTNIAATREILRRCKIQGMTCLDVGAMDGLISAILCRRNAGQVMACDRYNRYAQIDLVRKALGIDFQYLPDSTLADVCKTAPKLISNPFDLIVFSGVLYHMYDPMQGLAMIRSMVRTGGIVVIETAAAISDKHVGYFNAHGTNSSDLQEYWALSVTLLDYLLRYFRLKPLDCAYFTYPAKTDDGSQLARVAISCMATEQQLPDPQDKWMVANKRDLPNGRDDDAEYPVWNSQITPELEYRGMSANNPAWRSSGGIDLYQTISLSSPITITDDFRRLALGVDY